MTLSEALHSITAIMLRELGVDHPRAINSGNCEEWAHRARAIVGGRVVWLHGVIDADEFPIDEQPRVGHCVLHVDERWYDSEHPEGVTYVLMLAGFDEIAAITHAHRVVPLG